MSDGSVTLETYEVEVSVRGTPQYLIEVPTTLGQEAAERRAKVAIFKQRSNLMFDEVEATSSKLISSETFPARRSI